MSSPSPGAARRPGLGSLNEVQFPKELQAAHPVMSALMRSLNEVQFPKELQALQKPRPGFSALPSMKCSSRKNCKSELSVSHRSVLLPQ